MYFSRQIWFFISLLVFATALKTPHPGYTGGKENHNEPQPQRGHPQQPHPPPQPQKAHQKPHEQAQPPPQPHKPHPPQQPHQKPHEQPHPPQPQKGHPPQPPQGHPPQPPQAPPQPRKAPSDQPTPRANVNTQPQQVKQQPQQVKQQPQQGQRSHQQPGNIHAGPLLQLQQQRPHQNPQVPANFVGQRPIQQASGQVPQVLRPPQPPAKSQGQPLPLGITPARPILAPGAQVNSGPFPSMLGDSGARRVDDTQVSCEKTHMTVTFRFSAPFSGFIYPHNHFKDCLMFQGSYSREAVLTLRHGTCGDQEKYIRHDGNQYLDPIIEHRLMVQWEKDIVCEDDASVIVRCDRPDDFNKTVEWRLETRQFLATLEKSQHPGPRMWMEIQRGEGPTAPPLNNELVHVGDVLTLIFTLSDNVYWFDSNIIACYAFDGGEEKHRIEWDTTGGQEVSSAARLYSGEVNVIEHSCSVKPKVFSHFIKEKHTTNDGNLVTLHYAHFKAFRFPTSQKLIIQCNVQVCYKECPEPEPCSEAFHPRVAEEAKRRKRRQAESVADSGAHEVDNVGMRKSIEVQLREEAGAEKIPLASAQEVEVAELFADCYSSAVFTSVVVVLLCLVLILTILVITMCIRMKISIRPSSFFSPTKPQ